MKYIRINIERFAQVVSAVHLPKIIFSGTFTKEDIKTLEPKYLPLNGESSGYTSLEEDVFYLDSDYFEDGVSVNDVYYHSEENMGDWYSFSITGKLKRNWKAKDLNDIDSLSVIYEDYADGWNYKTLILQKYSFVIDGTEYTVFSSCGNPNSTTIEANKLNMIISLNIVHTGNAQYITVGANINKDYFEGLCNYFDSEDLYQDIQNNELSSDNYYDIWYDCYVYPAFPGIMTVIHRIPSMYLETAYVKGYGEDSENGNFGNNYAGGDCSHAEGYDTSAGGDYSHAEGYDTKASGFYQHAQGKYNIEDTSNKYADIIGNGTSSSRSNAYTLDWNGNAWFAGNIKIGGTSYDDENAIEVGANLAFNTEYNAETNKVATMADIEAVTASSLPSIAFINKPICNLTEYYNTTLTDEQRNTLSKKLQNYSVMVDVVGGKPVYELVIEYDNIKYTSSSDDSNILTFKLLDMTLSFGDTYGGTNLYNNGNSFFLIKDSCIYPKMSTTQNACGEFSDLSGYISSGYDMTNAIFEYGFLNTLTNGEGEITKMMFTIRYQKATDTEYQDAIQVLDATEEL